MFKNPIYNSVKSWNLIFFNLHKSTGMQMVVPGAEGRILSQKWNELKGPFNIILVAGRHLLFSGSSLNTNPWLDWAILCCFFFSCSVHLTGKDLSNVCFNIKLGNLKNKAKCNRNKWDNLAFLTFYYISNLVFQNAIFQSSNISAT